MMTQTKMKTDSEEEMKERLSDREHETYLRFRYMRPPVDWVETLLTVVIMVVTVIGFSAYLADLIEMVVDKSKFTHVKAAIDIFWATVFLSQWVYHLADKLVWKLKRPL